MSVSVEHFDPAVAPEALLRQVHDLYVALDAEEIPEDPSTPYEARVAHWNMKFDRFPVKRWIVRDDTQVVAAGLSHIDTEENLANGEGRAMVHPQHRGRGYARLLAEPVLDHLEEEGRTRLETWIVDGHPAESWAEALGLKSVLLERRSRLRLSELDHSLMAQWIERASERASDYELLEMTSPFPEEHLAKYCEMMEIMNTAPLDDLEMEDEHISPEDWRNIEAGVAAGHSQINNLTAVHKPTGDFAGYTQIKTQSLQPDLAWQWDTGVHPDHRNRGLGRWLKAEMIERLVAEFPEVDRVDTGNAGSNDAMLAINVAMGFKKVLDVNVWQGDLATARLRLGL